MSQMLEPGNSTSTGLSLLSPEQADTDRLLRELLGAAVADRYVDFCRLASGALSLTVSRPLAGHALRELDSVIRHVLATPLDAIASDEANDIERRREAKKRLEQIGFDESAIQRAEQALKPKLSHRVQIERIAFRLGLAPDGDIAKLWIKLNAAHGQVHKRSFHASLNVDEEFRIEFVQPFETVVRTLMVQLQSRYSALMRRVKEIAEMKPTQGVARFVNEIPGAIQLQTHFFDSLQSFDWLPHLAKRGLLAEPLSGAQVGSVQTLWSWPAGRYLARAAQSEDAKVRAEVVRAIRSVESSENPDVRRLGLDVIAKLPPADAIQLVDVVEYWINSTDNRFFTLAPQNLIGKFVKVGDMPSGMRVLSAVFAVFERDGRISAHFDSTMYEHFLNETVKLLEKNQPLSSLPTLCDLFRTSLATQAKIKGSEEFDFSNYLITSLEDNANNATDFLGSMVIAIKRVAEAAIRMNTSGMQTVLDHFLPELPNIFTRLRLHLLAVDPSNAPDLATAYLTNLDLVDASWCRGEYAKLARAWFSHLVPAQQSRILEYIDSFAEADIENWRQRFEQHEKRKPDVDDERKFRESTFRDAVWWWRDALPLERKAALDRTVREFGDPDAWRSSYFLQPESPLSQQTMARQEIGKTVEYLKSWRPEMKEQKQTVGALANALREAVQTRPDFFSENATSFAPLRPLFVRHVFDGLRWALENNSSIDWAECLSLAETTMKRTTEGVPASDLIEGDDPDWSWTEKSIVDWITTGFRRGTDGPPFNLHDRARKLVFALASKWTEMSVPSDTQWSQSLHPFFSAQQTLSGSVVEVVILYLFWASKDAATSLGMAPRNALAEDGELRAVLESFLLGKRPLARAARAIFGRYLNFLVYFGEPWVQEKMPVLFPRADDTQWKTTWVAHLQSDQGPVAALTNALEEFYQQHISVIGQEDRSYGGTDSDKRLAEYLMVLYLWECLPEPVLLRFWEAAPKELLRQSMWFISRHLTKGNAFQNRAKTYWIRRLQLAEVEKNKGLFAKELGVIGVWFLWDVDPDWLLLQLKKLLNAGYAPNDGLGILDKLAQRLPSKIDDIVDVVRALVQHQDVQLWIFGSQQESLRQILTEGKKSASPITRVAVNEIISILAARGNPAFLDLDDGL